MRKNNMDSTDGMKKILDELLINASALQEMSEDRLSFTLLSDQQSRLLDALFQQWDQLTEEEKTQAFESNLESRVQQLAKRNQACLKEVHEKRSLPLPSSMFRDLF